MGKKKVILFGSIGVATKCLDEIILNKDIDFVGAVCFPLKNTWEKKILYTIIAKKWFANSRNERCKSNKR